MALSKASQFWRWTVIDNYLSGQLLLVVVFGLLLFTVIWLAPETLFKLTGLFFDGKITLNEFLLLIVYDLPNVLLNAIPMAVLFGCIIVFRQLSLNLELVSFFSAGVGLFRLMKPVLLIGAAFSLLHFGVQEWVIPETAPVFDDMRRAVGLKDPQKLNFTFVEKDSKDRWKRFMLIEHIADYEADNQQVKDFLFLNYKEDTVGGTYIAEIVTAKSGQWSPDSGVWILNKGRQYTLDDNGVYLNNEAFVQRAVNTNENPIDLLKATLKQPKYMAMSDLSRYIRLLQRGNQLQDVNYYQVRLFQKLALPVASVFFAILGALLGMEPIRSRNQYALIFGALLLFLYSVLVPFTTNLGSLGAFNPMLVVSIPLLTALLLGVLLFNLRRVIEKV